MKNNEIYVLKFYVLDPSSYDVINVDVKVFSSLEKANANLKETAYKIYVDNEGDEVSIEDWKFELYDNYEYEIYSDIVNQLVNKGSSIYQDYPVLNCIFN